MRHDMKNFLHGLLIGVLAALPLYLVSEQIRYGFVSNHVALWVLVAVVCGIGIVAKEGFYLSWMWRMALFSLCAIVIIVLCLRVMHEQGMLLAILLFATVYACYAVFQVAGSTQIGQD